MVEIDVAQLEPPLRLVRGLIRGLLPGLEVLDQGGRGRISRAHFGEHQCAVARTEPVSTRPRALQPLPGRSGCGGPSGRAGEGQPRQREGGVEVERAAEPVHSTGVIGAALRRLTFEVQPECRKRGVGQAIQRVRLSRAFGEELSDQPVHQPWKAVGGTLRSRLRTRGAARHREQGGVERHVSGGADHATQEELPGTDPTGHLERGTLGEVVRVRAGRTPPGEHHGPRVRSARVSLSREPRGRQVDHALPQVAQLLRRAAHPEGRDGDQLRIQRDRRPGPQDVGRHRKGDDHRQRGGGEQPTPAAGLAWRYRNGAGLRGAVSPSANAAAVGKRSAGALAIARITLCSTATGTVSRTVRSGGTGSSA